MRVAPSGASSVVSPQSQDTRVHGNRVVHARGSGSRSERDGRSEALGATLDGCLPVEGLMRPVVEVVVQPGGDGSAQFVSTVPVAQPDELFLERADEALDDGVAGRATDGREGVGELPAPAERLAVGAGVLRAVVGAQLDT